MINVVYLVLVMNVANPGYGQALTSVTIPQANMEQCKINLKFYKDAEKVIGSHCIVGVMPK